MITSGQKKKRKLTKQKKIMKQEIIMKEEKIMMEEMSKKKPCKKKKNSLNQIHLVIQKDQQNLVNFFLNNLL